jgi:transposase
LTTKIHAVVDALGNPLAIRLTGGQAHDIAQAEALRAEVEPQALIADKSYHADGFIETLIVRRIEPVIPSKANRKGASPMRLRALRRTQSRRAFLQRPQTIPRHRNSLRKNRAKFSRPNPSRLRPRLAQMRTRPSRPIQSD